MSDLPVDAGAGRTPPLISFWLKPRQTIERIVADRPRYLVLPLITLGGAASAANMLAGYGLGSEIVGWRVLLICVVGAGIFAVFNFYVLAVITGWVGRKMGGVASNDAVRAVFAWGMLPSILGLALVLSIATGWRIVVPGAEPRLLSSLFDGVNGVCGLWGLIVTLMMLSRVERFGFWRTIVTYVVGTLMLAAWLALMVRSFLFQPFSLPAASMAPTLLPGDYVFAAKYPYGYTRYSLPFSPPLFSGRIFGSVPARRCDRFPPAKGCLDRIRQARRGASRRSHSDEGGRALHQRHGRQARARGGFRGERCVRRRSAQGEALARDAAGGGELRDPRLCRQGVLRQHQCFHRAGRPPVRARRQPRQLHR
jgi:hypothetical protein